MSGIMTAVAVANAAMDVYKSMSSTQEFPAMMDERLKQSGQAGKILYSYDGSITKLLSDYIVEPTIVAEPVEEYIPNKETIKAIEEGRTELAKYKKGLVKGYTNAQELINDILSEEDE